MRSADWKALSRFGLILGSILLLGGLFAYFYFEVHGPSWFRYAVYPYQGSAGPLLISGVVLIVVGYVARQRAHEEMRLEALPTPPQPVPPSSVAKRFCINCGTEIPAGARYCPSCGQKSQA